MAEWKPTNNPKDALGTAKAPLHLIPSTALVAASMAFLEGREKYGQFNWRVTGVRASVYQAALLRHMMAWFDGEGIDPDSGLPHLWKAIACLAILIDAQELGVLEDDRPPQAPTARLMADTKHLGEHIRAKLAGFDPFQYTERNRHSGPQEDPGPKVSALTEAHHQMAADHFRKLNEEMDLAVYGEASRTRLKREALEAIEEQERRYQEDPVPTSVRCPKCSGLMTFVDAVSPGASEYRCSRHGVFPVFIG